MSQISFKTRNLYYLRISEQSVLPVYVYLDERHQDWMSDQVLQHVLSDLRPRILPKLLGEAGIFANPSTTKTAVVDTHRGDNYQFCFFLRRTEPHSVAIKTRNYVARILPSGPTTNMSASTTPRTIQRPQRKRKTRSTASPAGSPPLRSSKKQRNDAHMRSDDLGESQDQGNAGTRNKNALVTQLVEAHQDEVIDLDAEEDMDEAWVPEDNTFDLSVEEDEEKPKPALQLKYKGFSIYGRCLCIVVEPWPPKRSMSRAPQESGGISSEKYKQKPIAQSLPTTIARAKIPLFLADDNDAVPDDVQRSKPVTNSWDDVDVEMWDDNDSDTENGGMMAFSQALNMAGDSRPGAMEDDNEMEGVVLFSDADEVRQL